MKPKPPCKDCQNRYVGCHGKCDAYKRFKQEQNDFKDELGNMHGKMAYFNERWVYYKEKRIRHGK